MASFLNSHHYDLVTPDGAITALKRVDDRTVEADIFIEKVSSAFVGYQIEPQLVFFNIKSTLAQLGLDGINKEIEFSKERACIQVKVELKSHGPLGKKLLGELKVGAYIGKLFAADPRRRVRDPDYLARMFGRADRWGKPLLSLGGLHGSDDLILDKVDGRTVAYLTLQNGRVVYDNSIDGFLPTLVKGLIQGLKTREFVRAHQEWQAFVPRNVQEDEILLVRTLPLHIRTVFGMVVDGLLASGYKHTSARILQPDTTASGDIYELYGNSKREVTDIPLEFYTLEAYREYVFFSDRDQLQTSLECSDHLFEAFATAPKPKENRAAVFVVKGEQLRSLTEADWISRETRQSEFPGSHQGSRQALMVERYIEQQPSYPFLKAIVNDLITSQGVLLTRYFPSPLMKRMLLSDEVQRCLKGIYFQYPSASYGEFFSAEDRALLHDLDKFAIPVYWVDERTKKILKFTQKPDRDSGLFVPLHQVETFLKSTVFGIYGSNLIEGDFEQELRILLKGILELRKETNHPLLSRDTPLSLVTGGGPGVMEVGNRVAVDLGILSCANIADFSKKSSTIVNEQQQNPYIEAKMTYRLDKLVERQAEFHLDFPIFLVGGVGTDFEYCLEEVRRKVGAVPPNPILLIGPEEYWRDKITSRFLRNLESGTIKGSEWLSNCFYCVQNAAQGLQVYRDFFNNNLPIGRDGPVYPEGFVAVPPLPEVEIELEPVGKE